MIPGLVKWNFFIFENPCLDEVKLFSGKMPKDDLVRDVFL